jgi:hypothetical protein
MTNSNTELRPDCSSLEIFFIDPSVVEVSEDLFREDPPTDEISEMAISMYTFGQRRPVECRRVGIGKIVLVHGFIRAAAAKMIQFGFKYRSEESGQESEIKDKKFKLKIVFSDAIEEVNGKI